MKKQTRVGLPTTRGLSKTIVTGGESRPAIESLQATIERLNSVLLRLLKEPFPTGQEGAALLQALEATNRIRDVCQAQGAGSLRG